MNKIVWLHSGSAYEVLAKAGKRYWLKAVNSNHPPIEVGEEDVLFEDPNLEIPEDITEYWLNYKTDIKEDYETTYHGYPVEFPGKNFNDNLLEYLRKIYPKAGLSGGNSIRSSVITKEVHDQLVVAIEAYKAGWQERQKLFK